jgi:zinc transport system substrate-binding protein
LTASGTGPRLLIVGIVLITAGGAANQLQPSRRRRVPADVIAVGLAFLVALSLAACGRGSTEDEPGDVVVVASFYPLAEAARRVGGPDVTIHNLTPPGVEPHDLELAPDDLELILTADVVLYVGAGFQPAVEDAIADVEGRALDALEGIQTLEPPEEDEEHAGEEEQGEAELTADPHVWLDPILYAQIVDHVADVFAAVSPQRADVVREKAQAFEAELRSLDEDYSAGLEKCDGSPLVVNHAAFGYLAAAYGLVQQPISGISPEAEVDPARLAELRDLVEREGVTTIFTEELASPEVAETLAAEAGVRTAVLNPLEGLTEEQVDAGEDYLSVMRQNLMVLKDGLGCA